MDKKMIADNLVRASMSLKVADEAFETFVKPYEQVLHSMGFKSHPTQQGLKENNAAHWFMDLDASKYDADVISVTITSEKVIIAGGHSGSGGKEYEWDYRLKQLPATRLRSTIQSHIWEMEKSVAKVARQLLAMAKKIMIADDVNALNGLRVQAAKRYVNKILDPHTKGFFSDNSWEAVHKLWKVMDDNGIVYTMTGADYQKDEAGRPSSKTWKFEVDFWNEKGRMSKLYGVIVAAGAGSVEDPLDRYDLVAYVS